MVVLVSFGVVVEILGSSTGLHGSCGVVGGGVDVWCGVVCSMDGVDRCVVWGCGVVRVANCGVGGGLGVVSIAVGVGWGAIGEVLGEVAIVVIVGVMVGGVWSILVVAAVLGCRFLPLLRLLVLLTLVYCPTK